MYKTICFILITLGASINWVHAQDSKVNNNWYSTSGGELIFSWADATKDGLDATVVTRFSPVLNIQYQLHKDFSQHFGFFQA